MKTRKSLRDVSLFASSLVVYCLQCNLNVLYLHDSTQCYKQRTTLIQPYFVVRSLRILNSLITEGEKRRPEICLLFAGYPTGNYDKTVSSAEASLCCGEAGEKEKESMRGMMGREKRGLCHIMCGSLAGYAALWFWPNQPTIWMHLNVVLKIIV